ncbi:hypothetical protein [Candidatus Nitrospira neomarina]|uniref:Uncharacterized protein n=1 Tax=Candidatus Nitrospira neomarina TaxID=3020899 RepID=A0AA96GGF8_9BACT|nr:hypothetical protein [Candidatus Nitrospira neomarina]WNM60512.1 hypothetical protein PQG83_12145 [Candidatus Nitrospira neomarina]
MPIPPKSCSDIAKGISEIRKEFGAEPLELSIKLGENYFEMENPAFSLAYDFKMLFQDGADKYADELIKGLNPLLQKFNVDDRLNLNEYYKETTAKKKAICLIPGLATLDFALRDNRDFKDALTGGRFSHNYPGFGGVRLKKPTEKALYVNSACPELKRAPNQLEHLVTHEFLHLHAHNGGFNDWKPSQQNINETIKWCVDEGFTEFLARLITYRRNKKNNDLKIEIMVDDQNLPKYEIFIRVVEQMLKKYFQKHGLDFDSEKKSKDYRSAWGKAYLSGEWTDFKRIVDEFNIPVQERKVAGKVVKESTVVQLLEAASKVGSNMDKKVASGSNIERDLVDWEVLPKPKKGVNAFEEWKKTIRNSVETRTYSDPILDYLKIKESSEFIARVFSLVGLKK